MIRGTHELERVAPTSIQKQVLHGLEWTAERMNLSESHRLPYKSQVSLVPTHMICRTHESERAPTAFHTDTKCVKATPGLPARKKHLSSLPYNYPYKCPNLPGYFRTGQRFKQKLAVGRRNSGPRKNPLSNRLHDSGKQFEMPKYILNDSLFVTHRVLYGYICTASHVVATKNR
jgi:hypothetical protein